MGWDMRVISQSNPEFANGIEFLKYRWYVKGIEWEVVFELMGIDLFNAFYTLGYWSVEHVTELRDNLIKLKTDNGDIFLYSDNEEIVKMNLQKRDALLPSICLLIEEFNLFIEHQCKIRVC